MRESEIESILVSEIRREGGKAYKWVSPGNSGVPDRIIIMPGGRISFVELKTEVGRPTGLQWAQIRRLSQMGCDVEVVAGLRGVYDWLRRHDMPNAADRVMHLILRDGRR